MRTSTRTSWSPGGLAAGGDVAANSLEALRQVSIKRQRTQRYDIVSIGLHWLTAILVVVQVTIALIMTSLASGPAQNAFFYTHKSLGITLLLVVVFRVLWKILYPWPPLPSDVPHGQVMLSRTIHLLLYLTLLVMAISGYVFTAAGGYPVPFFGIAQLGGLIGKNPDLSEWLETVHVLSQWVLYALVSLHVLGAFYHLLVRKDGVFQRMWPT